jgi:cytochrome c
MLNNSSLNSQLKNSKKCDFYFSFKTNGLTPSFLVAHPCATGSTELISASLTAMIKVFLTIALLAFSVNYQSMVYAQADEHIVAGAHVYVKCIACHSPTYHRTGPKHCGLLGRQAGSEVDFTYTSAMKTSGIIWTTETLDIFLKAPLAMVPGTSMGVFGISSSTERSLLIRYLSQLNAENPLCK